MSKTISLKSATELTNAPVAKWEQIQAAVFPKPSHSGEWRQIKAHGFGIRGSTITYYITFDMFRCLSTSGLTEMLVKEIECSYFGFQCFNIW